MIVVDTNVPSEILRPRPDRSVLAWVAAVASRNVRTTSITRAELLLRAAILPDGKRRRALENAMEAVFAATVATRNTADFELCGVTLENPWHFVSGAWP